VIVAELKAEQALVDANRQLIQRFEKKIHAIVARTWDEDRGQGSSRNPNVVYEQSCMSKRSSQWR